jgi:NADH-quinone oxidoreductase subunit A
VLQSYVPIFLFAAVAIGLAVVTILFFRPADASTAPAVNLSPHEWGTDTDRDREGIRYYLIAMLVVLVDAEAIFLFPWAVSLDRLAVFGLLAMLVVLSMLVVGSFYAWKTGALD